MKRDIIYIQSRKIGVRDIQKAVCEYYGISEDVLLSLRRDYKVWRARQVAYKLANELTDKSTGEVARLLHRDRSTISYAYTMMSEWINKDTKLKEGITEIRKILLERFK